MARGEVAKACRVGEGSTSSGRNSGSSAKRSSKSTSDRTLGGGGRVRAPRKPEGWGGTTGGDNGRGPPLRDPHREGTPLKDPHGEGTPLKDPHGEGIPLKETPIGSGPPKGPMGRGPS